VGVYAHNIENNEYNDLDYMDTMHEYMVRYIEDPELRDIMDQYHKGCVQSYSEESAIVPLGMGMI